MAATVDIVARGRLDFGIGVGGSIVPDAAAVEGVRREYEAYGVDVVPVRDAVAALGEACTIFKRMWTEVDPFDFAGRHYRLKGAICEPKPIQRPGPPILIGAGGERALRVVAEHADIWNAPVRTIEEFRHKSRVLDEHCATVGRDPSEIVRSKQLLVNAVDPSAPEATQRALLDLIDAGARHLVLAPFPPLPPAGWLAEEIVEPVLERVATRVGREPT